MLDKWKLVIIINKPSVYANSKTTAYLLIELTSVICATMNKVVSAVLSSKHFCGA